jgi:predicted metal-dependent phosphoesterase TrpH
MNDRIDLHIHSNKSSDGDFSPFHIIHMAKKTGLKAISISDHDTVAAYPEALALGEKAGVEVIPGIELSTVFDSREFHLLLPFVLWGTKAVKRLESDVKKRRALTARERVNKLRGLGFDISWKEVIQKSGAFPPLGVTIAQVLLDAPYLFYKDFFMEGKPAFVPSKDISLLDMLDIVGETGGVPVLAHPGASFQNVNKKDLSLLKSRGLKGLEVYTSYHNEEQTRNYKRLAEEFDLVPTAGSDFHGMIKPHITFGSVKEGGYWMIDKLRKRRP